MKKFTFNAIQSRTIWFFVFNDGLFFVYNIKIKDMNIYKEDITPKEKGGAFDGGVNKSRIDDRSRELFHSVCVDVIFCFIFEWYC